MSLTRYDNFLLEKKGQFVQYNNPYIVCIIRIIGEIDEILF